MTLQFFKTHQNSLNIKSPLQHLKGHLKLKNNFLKILGSGAHIRAYKESKAVLILRAGDHSFFRISKQIAPVWLEIFGCQILVSNFIFGGLYG